MFYGDQVEALGGGGGTGTGAVAGFEEDGNVGWGEAAAAHVEESADDFADHVAKEGAAADFVDYFDGFGG